MSLKVNEKFAKKLREHMQKQSEELRATLKVKRISKAEAEKLKEKT